MWLRINGSWVAGTSGTGNPATGAYPTYTAVVDGTYTPMGAPWQGHSSGGSGAVHWRWNFGQNGTFTGEKTAQGNADGNGHGDFYYSVPSGFYALCSKNLPTSTIKEPGDYFNVVRWTGNGSTQSISGVGFQPDLAWIKNRTAADNHKWTDAVRGATKEIESNSTDAEATNADGLTSFASDGFALGDDDEYNTNTEKYVSWNWLAGTAPTADNSASAGATPTAGSVKIDGANLGSALAGSIAATRLSANTTSGFSIVKYTSGGSTGTVAHGLGVKPDIVLQKRLDDTEDWYMYTDIFDGTPDAINLSGTGGKYDWNNGVVPTTSVFTETNNSSAVVVSYCIASVEGFSKVGIYEANNSTDGPFVYTGFNPQYIMIKYADGTDESWWIQSWETNSYNKSNWPLFANLTAVEGEAGVIDFLSNGFKLRATNGGINGNTDTYMYIAFADYPFKYSNAR